MNWLCPQTQANPNPSASVLSRVSNDPAQWRKQDTCVYLALHTLELNNDILNGACAPGLSGASPPPRITLVREGWALPHPRLRGRYREQQQARPAHLCAIYGGTHPTPVPRPHHCPPPVPTKALPRMCT